MKIIAVPPQAAWTALAFLRPLIEKACSHGCQEAPESLIADAADCRAVLWIIANGNTPIAVCITRKVALPDGTLLIRGEVLGGERAKEWAQPLMLRLHEFRKAEGAKALIWTGRRGWARLSGVKPEMHSGGYWLFKDFG